MRKAQVFTVNISHQSKIIAEKQRKQNLCQAGSLITTPTAKKLFLKFKDGQTKKEYISEFVLLYNGCIVAYHDCPVVRKRNSCWHLAFAADNFAAAGYAPMDHVLVQIKNPDISYAKREMCLVGTPDTITLLNLP
jgi:hypothetical protein